MKKIFSFLAAVLFAGSMMAGSLIKFEEPAAATAVAGSTYGSEGFTLSIPAESDKASIDANSCTFGLSAEETVSFTHRLKTGGASSKAGRKFTLNIPEEGPLAIYARTSKSSATDRNFVIRNGSDTIVNHICLDTDTVEDASSKIFLPFIVENVPAGSYEISYPVEGINFYGFELVSDAPAAMDTIFFVNAADWAVVKVHAWGGTAAGTAWPGLDVEKADYQLQGKDVYFFVAEAGAYGKCIFNNNNKGAQTANLDWTPGKYYYNGAWYTREELDAPVVVDMYLKHNWAGAGSWTWKQMTYDAEAENYILRDIYGASGCNWNTSASDNGSTWVANPTVVGNPAVGDSAVFAFKNGEITITKIGEPAPEPTTRWMKHNWAGLNAWTWKEMTREGETDTYTLRDIYGGTGCNWNTVGNDAGATWVAEPILEGEPAVGDSAIFTLVEGAITITKIEGEGPGPEPTYNYYLAGSMNTPAWGSVAMPGDSIVLTLAAGEHGFKVQVAEGVWDGALTYDNVNAECSSDGIYTNGDRNVMFTLTEAGEVKIKVVEGQICVTGAFQVPETYNYYLAGTMNSWGSTGMDGDSIVLNLEAGEHKFKIQLVAGYWDTALGFADVDMERSSEGLSSDNDGNVVFTLEEAGDVKIKMVAGKICVTLPASGQTTGLENVKDGKAVKMVENGQVVIIKNGVRYNVMGKSL